MKDQTTVPRTRILGSCRLVIMICCFMSMLTNFSGQSLMTSAMVCMIAIPTGSVGDVINNTANGTTKSQEDRWKFSWDSKEQNLILSAYFTLYFLGQLPSGILAQRFSGRKSLIIGQTITGILHVLTVPAAQWGVPGVFVVRLLGGGTSSLLYSNCMAVLASWTPRHEKSATFGCVGVGMEIGNLLAFSLSMFACQIDLIGGWPFVFFCQGALQFIVVGLFMFCVEDSPLYHRKIKPDERAYLLSTTMQKKTWTNTPVRAIVTSLPVLAVVVSKIAALCGYFMFIVVTPQFARDILKLPSFYVSLVYSLPFLLTFPALFVMGRVADYIVANGIASNTTVRKVSEFANKVVFAVLLIVFGHLPEKSWPLTLTMNIAIIIVLGAAYLTYEANPADLSPAHTGFTSAYVQASSYWITIITPIAVGFITQETTRENWQTAMYIVAGMQLVAFIFYCMFGSGELQPWALEEQSIIVIPDDEKQETDILKERTYLRNYDSGKSNPSGGHS